jgi:hypothetical protein
VDRWGGIERRPLHPDAVRQILVRRTAQAGSTGTARAGQPARAARRLRRPGLPSRAARRGDHGPQPAQGPRDHRHMPVRSDRRGAPFIADPMAAPRAWIVADRAPASGAAHARWRRRPESQPRDQETTPRVAEAGPRQAERQPRDSGLSHSIQTVSRRKTTHRIRERLLRRLVCSASRSDHSAPREHRAQSGNGEDWH